MEGCIHCQSCGMPLDHPELLGTEKDGSKSTIYCLYCYQHGAFTHPAMSLEEMKGNVRAQLERTQAAEATISDALARLPRLLRWQGYPAIHHRAEMH